MSKNNNFDLIDQLEGLENIPPIRNVAGEELSQRRSQKNNTKKTTVDDISEISRTGK
jgi:hypothetical protein